MKTVDSVQLTVYSCGVRFADGFEMTGTNLQAAILNLSPKAIPQLSTVNCTLYTVSREVLCKH